MRISENVDFHKSLLDGGVMDIVNNLVSLTDVAFEVQCPAAILLSRLSLPVISV